MNGLGTVLTLSLDLAETARSEVAPEDLHFSQVTSAKPRMKLHASCRLYEYSSLNLTCEASSIAVSRPYKSRSYQKRQGIAADAEMSTQDDSGISFEISNEQQNFRLLELPPSLLALIISKDPPKYVLS